VAGFKELGTALTGHNCIRNKIKSTLNSGNAFGPESFVFPFYIYEDHDRHTHTYSFVCCFVWVFNIQGRTQAGYVVEQSAEEDIWA